MTLLSDIGKAVVGVLQHPDQTKNRAVYVQSACVSQNDLLNIAKKVKPGFEPKVKEMSTAEFERGAYGKSEEGEHAGNDMMDFVFISVYGEGYKSDWSDGNDDDLFGIRKLDEKGLEDVVRKYVP